MVRSRRLKMDRYLCQMCLKANRVTNATLVDHVIPIRVDPSRRLDMTNLQSLDVTCHALKTAQDKLLYPQYYTS